MIRQDWSMLKKLMFAKTAAGGAAAVEATATGNPLIFLTDLARPLKSLLIPFTPKQTGSGDPSPVNVRPIVPWEGLTVEHGGKNLYDKTQGKEGFVWWEGREQVGYEDYKASAKIPVVPNTKYTLSKDETGQNQLQYFNKNGEYVGQDTSSLGYTVATITIPDNVYFVAFNIAITALDSAQFEVGSSATAYETYVPITETDVSFPSPVYGGTLDVVSGVLSVEWFCITPKWNEGANPSVGVSYTRKSFRFPYPVRGVNGQYFNGQRCNIAKLLWDTAGSSHFYIDESTAYVWLPNDTDGNTEVQVLSKLITPQEIQLTPQQITALVGKNTIWSDADGSMTAIYLKKG